MVYEITDTSRFLPLFRGWEETMIYACLQGIMGKLYSSGLPCAPEPACSPEPACAPEPLCSTEPPVSAMAVLGDFTFFAGQVSRELIAFKPEGCTKDFMIMVGQNKDWQNAIVEYYGPKARVVSRYAFKKEPEAFDRKALEAAAASLPPGLSMDLIDEPLYHLCRSRTWSLDLVSQFHDYEEYRRLGLGVVIRKGGEIVSGASSYSRYRDGIEIEIDTREDHRRQGLAYICGARLILECLNRGLYPSWDAQNPGSAALAGKLGYHFSHTYTAVEITGY